jgi:NaMN:DMB phosphoribosyltransferase
VGERDTMAPGRDVKVKVPSASLTVMGKDEVVDAPLTPAPSGTPAPAMIARVKRLFRMERIVNLR